MDFSYTAEQERIRDAIAAGKSSDHGSIAASITGR